MKLILKRNWTVFDWTERKLVAVPAGTHAAERVLTEGGEELIVLKGTMIGSALKFWQLWKESRWGSDQVIVTD